MVRDAEAPTGLPGNPLQVRGRLGVPTPVAGHDERHVRDAARPHLVGELRVMAALVAPHRLAAIKPSASGIRRAHTHVQRRHAAREGGRCEDICGAESWSGSDDFRNLGRGGGVGQVRKVEEAVANLVVPVRALRGGAAQGVGGRALNDAATAARQGTGSSVRCAPTRMRAAMPNSSAGTTAP